MRVGFGYDIHRLKKGRNLVLAGVTIPHTHGESGHSDGDVLIHAVIDAIFGALSEGDIGTHFPPGDPDYKGISSRILLRKTKNLLDEKNVKIINIDCTVVLEKPKIATYTGQMRENLAQDLFVDHKAVSIKGKTKEGCGEVGHGKAVEAFAVVLIQ
ncbi:MAG: 2-C-methyl-D-erythritol 2,4-cyclodiphosphate synthase [Spirochaetales bacterium]|nr:2-C-methyl-D-erythritol 2,4-cyclodiphosphate synthase [Spirochaetales bacterium]